ncbi:uncharacterized protein isoform X1 [Salmo salar]|uniref:Uncharacterized protein isoform X1 n=1 Tax=Salmo salar TaxID=8030 RepID=A0ABM3D876_SALSA|nr:uncharacterized protein LOC106575470 isoform X1 [Salmo salar]
MPKLTLIGLYLWICLAQKVVSGEDLYYKVGGELLLTPDKSTVPDSITGILWKHGKNKVAEWYKDFDLDIYAAFKERTTLDQTTGELRISGLMKTDSGVYSVEFNSKLLDKTYTLSVIKAVPKPTITSSCNANKTICTLTCEGDTTDAEPVTYSWKVGEGVWEVLDKQHSVSKNNTDKSNNGYKYTCKLKNTVSEEVSKPINRGVWSRAFHQRFCCCHCHCSICFHCHNRNVGVEEKDWIHLDRHFEQAFLWNVWDGWQQCQQCEAGDKT